MGIYPVNPAEGIYVMGSPMFEQADIEVEDGKRFSIEAKGASKENKYIQGATLNGSSLDRAFIRHSELMQGGKLVLTMGPKPNKEWASLEKNYPPSMTQSK